LPAGQVEHCQALLHCQKLYKTASLSGQVEDCKAESTPAIKAALGLHISSLAERNGCCQVHATSPCRCHYAIRPCNHVPIITDYCRTQQVARANIKNIKKDLEKPSRSMGLQKGSCMLSLTADHEMLGGEEAWDCPQCRDILQVTKTVALLHVQL